MLALVGTSRYRVVTGINVCHSASEGVYGSQNVRHTQLCDRYSPAQYRVDTYGTIAAHASIRMPVMKKLLAGLAWEC